MIMNEISIKWSEWVDHYGWTEESVNNFCNINATSYEEYMTLWELLTDSISEKGE